MNQYDTIHIVTEEERKLSHQIYSSVSLAFMLIDRDKMLIRKIGIKGWLILMEEECKEVNPHWEEAAQTLGECLNELNKEHPRLYPYKPSKSITTLEKSKGRSGNYHSMSPREQWDEDKELGILDWDGK